MKSSKLNSPVGNRPFVLVNMAMTADGKIASANRAVAAFSSQHDQRHMLVLRATADAVMCGARTLESGPLTLGPGSAEFRRRRLRAGLAEYNLRVIVSGTGSITRGAEVFKHRFSPLILLTTKRVRRLRTLQEIVDVVRLCGESEIDFADALRWLKAEWHVNRLLCEGGGQVNSALFEAGLVDELHLTLCPKILGGRTAPTIADGRGFPELAAAVRFELKSARRVGDETFLVYRRLDPEAAASDS